MLAVNQAPVNSVPAAQTAQINQPFAFTQYRGNAFSISDADAGDNTVRVTLSVDSGTITLVNPSPNGNITYSIGDGTEDTSMSFTGTVANINTALQWVSFNPSASYTGLVTFTIITNDLGMVGTGGAKSDTDTIAITVSPLPAFAPSPTYETLPGVLDTSFNGTGKKLLSLSSGVDYVRDLKVLPSGKILAIGAANDRFAVMRFTADMMLDTSFGENGVVRQDFGKGIHASCFTLDAAGCILVAGGNCIVRYNPDGTPDIGFGTNGVYTPSSGYGTVNTANAITVRPDGALVIVGKRGGPGTIPSFGVNLISRTGAHLSSWDHDPFGGFYDDAMGVVARDDGDLLVAGRATNYSYYSDMGFYVSRFNSVGTVEAEYNNKFRPDSRPSLEPFINSVLPLPDGKFLAVGIAYNDLAVARFNFNGTLDMSFGTNGLALVPVLNDQDAGVRATLAPDGKILITGFTSNGQNQDLCVARLSYHGTIDPSFGNNGVIRFDFGGTNDSGSAIAVMPDGKIVVAGSTANDIAMVRLLGDSRETEVFDVPAGQEVHDNGSHTGESQLIKRGPGRLIIDLANDHKGGIVVEAGEIIVRNVAALGSGSLDIRSGAVVTLEIGSLNSNGGNNFITLTRPILDPAGKFEIGNGQIRMSSGGYDVATIRALLLAGRNGGSWDGASGITSNFAGGDRSIGYRVADGALEVAYAAPGDGNLDGVFDILDLSAILSAGKFDTGSPANWTQGDTNYDNVFDIVDLADILGTGLFNEGTYLTQGSASSAAVEAGAVGTFDPSLVFAALAAEPTTQPTTKRRAV